MSVTLAKGGNVSLSKQAPDLTKVAIGLGWDVRTTTGADYDLDASALACGTDLKVLSDLHFIFYNNLRSPEGTIEHTGDNLTGEGDGDDEVINIDLAATPPSITNVFFAVSIHDADAPALLSLVWRGTTGPAVRELVTHCRRAFAEPA